MARMGRQAVLPRARFKITHVCKKSASPVVAAAGFGGPRASGLPAVVQETDRISAEFRCCPSPLSPRCTVFGGVLLARFLLRWAATCAGTCRLCLGRACGSGCRSALVVGGVTPPLSQLPV